MSFAAMSARHLVESEAVFLGGDLRVEDDLQQQVAEFLAEVGVVAIVDRLDDFVGFLDHAGAQAGVGLFAVPRATAGSA